MLSRENRLNLAKEFSRFKKYGFPLKTPYFTILWLKENEGNPQSNIVSDLTGTTPSGVMGPRIGFVVSNRLGKAAVRNQIRRLLRELVRPNISNIPSNLKLVIIALPAILKADPALIKNEIIKAFKNIKFKLESNKVKL